MTAPGAPAPGGTCLECAYFSDAREDSVPDWVGACAADPDGPVAVMADGWHSWRDCFDPVGDVGWGRE